MSKFDQPDPGLDPEYCNGLSDEPGPDIPHMCFWCGDSYDAWVNYYHVPYCSSLCARHAELDDCER